MSKPKGKPDQNARVAAAQAVAGVLRGQSLDDFGAKLDAAGRDAGLARAIAFGTVRELGSLRWIIKQLTPRMPDDRVTALLAIGLFQLRSLRVPPHAAVSETVDAAKGVGKPKAGGMVNAVLRRYQREADALNAKLPPYLDHPDWLVQAIKTDWPDRWREILDAGDTQAPMTLRVNARKTTRDAYLQQLAEADIDAKAGLGPQAIELATPVGVSKLPGFADGMCSVQDSAAQIAATLVDLPAGARVLDACAAPGGKTAHLLETFDVDLFALDVDAGRNQRVNETLKRLDLGLGSGSGLRATVRAGDASQPGDWWDGTVFDAILIDAPCSGTGVIRRHPDIKWLRRASDIDALAALQRRILDALWPLLRPGGTLIYATCSILNAENRDVVAQFLADTPDAAVHRIDGSWGKAMRADTPTGSYPVGRRIAPGGAFDGFFYARLTKSALSSADVDAGSDQ